MTAMLLRRLAWLLIACLLFLRALEHFNPHPPRLLVQADYQRCIPINPGPLAKRKFRGSASISEVA